MTVVIPGPANSPFGKLDYLLGLVPDNQSSQGKAGFFAGVMGFDHVTLRQALTAHLLDNLVGATRAGTRIVVTGPMMGPSGRTAEVLAVWRYAPNEDIVFVTAYPR